MSSITLRDIRKSYSNGPRVLHGVDLDIGDAPLEDVFMRFYGEVEPPNGGEGDA